MITYPNLYHLKYFVDAVASGSISGAAQKNSVTHPAVSRAISSLEKHLGTPLLLHQKKSFKLTAAGYHVAEQARMLLSAAEGFDSLSLGANAGKSVELRIGISRTLSHLYLKPLLQSLIEKFPDATAKVRFATTNEIVEAVANQAIDLGITVGNLNFATLRQVVVRRGQFYLVESGPKERWKGRLDSKSFILTEPRLETEKLKAAYRKEFHRSLPILYEISSWDVLAQLVQQGAGIGLLPDISIEKWRKGSYRIVEVAGFESSYEVYVHSSKSVSNQAIEYARDVLMNESFGKQTYR